MASITFAYEVHDDIDDGYVGGSRSIEIQLDLSDSEAAECIADSAELERRMGEEMRFHFEQNVRPSLRTGVSAAIADLENQVKEEAEDGK